jgi:hypothetical protein
MKQFMALSREHADVTVPAGRYATLTDSREANLSTAQEMLNEPDMTEMAQEEDEISAAGRDHATGSRTATAAAAQRP